MTMYQSINLPEETTIVVEKKADLRKALKKVFGEDNAECYLYMAINTGKGYELSLYNKQALEVFNAL